MCLGLGRRQRGKSNRLLPGLRAADAAIFYSIVSWGASPIKAYLNQSTRIY